MATASRRSRQALTMLVVGLSAAGPGRAVAQQERNRDDPFARMEYFYRQRAYPLQRVPPGALQAARAAYGARWPAAVRAQRLQAASSLGAWAGFGPSPILTFCILVRLRVRHRPCFRMLSLLQPTKPAYQCRQTRAIFRTHCRELQSQSTAGLDTPHNSVGPNLPLLDKEIEVGRRTHAVRRCGLDKQTTQTQITNS